MSVNIAEFAVTVPFLVSSQRLKEIEIHISKWSVFRAFKFRITIAFTSARLQTRFIHSQYRYPFDICPSKNLQGKQLHFYSNHGISNSYRNHLNQFRLMLALGLVIN